MAIASTLGSGELLEALTTIAAVLADHAPALDRLERGSEWDGFDDDGRAPGADAAPPTPVRPASGSDIAAALAAAVTAARPTSGLSRVAAAAAEGARTGATTAAGRGIGSVLGGLAEALVNADRLDGERLAIGLELAAEHLAPADDGSHAGCLPAVVAAAADAALAAVDAGAVLPDVVIAAADDGLTELESGPVANPRLVERGVVDAAAAGFLLVLDALASVLTGEPLPAPPMDPVELPAGAGAQPDTGRYRVTCRVEPHEGCGIESANWLESLWFELGVLERFEPFERRWEVSLVTPEPGRAIEAVFDVGRPRDLRVVAVAHAT